MYSVKRNYHYKFSLTSILVLVFWAITSFAQAQDTLKTASALGDATAGQALFEANCQSCHAATDEVVVGPGLKDILKRRTIEWLIPWVKNSQKVIKSGDPYAVALFEKYNKAVMNSFEGLKDDEIKSIFAYVEAYKPPVSAGGQTTGEAGQPTGTAESGTSNYFTLLLGILVVVLVLILAVLVLLMSVLNRFLQQREGDLSNADKEVLNQKFNVFSVLQSRAFLWGITIIFVVVVVKSGFDGLVGIGMQQGYAPTQPIAFSHKLHAGQYEIDCGYCHTGVYKGKSATIPSANICMNCHNAIKRESPEIKKIYAALENDKPIEWVRVHNLPDLAYFNHAQHTNVAGLACEKCHGEIKEMEVVAQRAPLTMGWCINCHRQTVVEHAAKNPYYDRLMEYHAKHGKSQMTVENIGGLECSKCHY
ncbi:MAG: c-type cytochrome [Microscillaceae bacterium]|nr:c-type cytochrome [Microscillaceae bacterium]